MAELRDAALAYPESHEDFPWGHSAIKIRTKVFVFLFLDPAGAQLTMSAKLPQSSEVALLLPFATPTGYGLAKSGWVTASFRPGDEVPVDLLRSWIDESYRAIAPAKLAKQLPSANPATTHPTSAKRTTTSKTPAAKRTTTAKPSSAKTTATAKSAKPSATAKPSSAKRTTSPTISAKPSKPSKPAARPAATPSKPAAATPPRTRAR